MNSEARILDLCGKAITADDSEVERVIADLKSALRDHMRHSRTLLSSYPFQRIEVSQFRQMSG